MKDIEVDIAILGGGIAGLWLLNRLRQLGFTAILLESGALGGGQTHKAQGIIHGGIKYALQGMITPATDAIAAMPNLWMKCLEGTGPINLSQVPILSYHQYLWTTGSLASKFAGYFAGLALRGNVKILNKEEYPAIFQREEFRGQVYSLNEIVIDVHALVRELVKPNQDVIFKVDAFQPGGIKLDKESRITSLELHAGPLSSLNVKAQRYIFTAGENNELFVKALATTKLGTQRRPLHMVVVKHDLPYELFAHCLGFGAIPKVTITTHKASDGKNVWYIGGQIAEEGVKRSQQEQIEIAQVELKELFPWVDFSGAHFHSFFVDRAEALQADGKRPDSFSCEKFKNSIIGWPTKMALAPLLSEKIIDLLTEENIQPGKSQTRELRAWPFPALAVPVWDQF